MSTLHHVILGNGIAGVSAAIRMRELDPACKITMISGESRYHYSRPALMYVFMGHMRYADTKPYEDRFWPDQRIDLVRDWVVGIDTAQRTLQLHRGEPLRFDNLLLATGSKSNKFGWPGQDLDGVQGLYGLMDLEALHRNTEGAKHAVIVGGGLIGIELAEMLHSRGVHVTMLVRESSYWNNVLPAEESVLVTRVVRDAGIDLRLGTELREIVDDGRGRACAVITGEGERIACQIVGLTAGVSPNLDVVADTPVETGRGILVDWNLRTNVEGIFAAGDCAEIVNPGEQRNLLQQVWYTGKLQGRCAAENMAGRAARYDPGMWYNSAKFLDLEYQTYGRIHFGVPGEESLYWEHDDGLHAVRITHVAGTVIGVNVMGIRYRHEVCGAWVRDERSLEYVLAHLDEANFDPEFFQRFEAAVRISMEAVR